MLHTGLWGSRPAQPPSWVLHRGEACGNRVCGLVCGYSRVLAVQTSVMVPEVQTHRHISGAERVPMHATGAFVYVSCRGAVPAGQRVVSVGTRRHRGVFSTKVSRGWGWREGNGARVFASAGPPDQPQRKVNLWLKLLFLFSNYKNEKTKIMFLNLNIISFNN